MELNHVTSGVSLALQAISALQEQAASNIAGISSGVTEVKHTDFRALLSHLSSTGGAADSYMSVAQLTEQLSLSKAAVATQMAEEVLISQRLAGKYSTVIEAYNRQLALYRLAVTGRA